LDWIIRIFDVDIFWDWTWIWMWSRVP